MFSKLEIPFGHTFDRRRYRRFAKTILSQNERDGLSSTVAFGLNQPGFQSRSERRVRGDVDEGVRPAHEGAARGHRQPRRDVSEHPGVDPPAEVGAARRRLARQRQGQREIGKRPLELEEFVPE